MYNKTIVITDDHNNEYEFEIVFTFSSDDDVHNYVVVEDKEQYMVLEYFEDINEIKEVDDEKVIQTANELLITLFKDNEEKDG